ncbi:MAG: GDP-mannose 4,6-dehydratase [Oscillospiraceae bacterium]
MDTKQKALIIGACGFVGNYLIEQLVFNCSISITKLPNETILNNHEDIGVYNLNILNIDEIRQVLNKIRPQYIYHLAAQSSVAKSWENPCLTVDVNIKGTINLLEAVRQLDYKPRILLVGSGEEYGCIKPNETPITEENKLRPGNIYAITKATQNMIGKLYTSAYDMDIVMVRAFNHIGPGQLPQFVVADFCKQVADIEKGHRQPVIYVGNLSAVRDFTDVRDIVKAYELLMEKGKSGETYNVGSSRGITIDGILKKILKLSPVEIVVETDVNKLRPIDVPIVEVNISKLQHDTGWTPKIDIDQTLKETLDYWRNYKE